MCYTYCMPQRNDKFKAYKLRMSGKSYSDINRLLGVPKGTLSSWFSDLDISQEVRDKINKKARSASLGAIIRHNNGQTNRAQAKARTIRDLAREEVGPISKRDLFVLGVGLYWAEGHKKPIVRNGKARTYHPVSFTNSDPKLVALFVRFIKEICAIDENKISIGIRFSEHQDPIYLLDFWQKIVRIPTERFSKTIQAPGTSSSRKRPFNSLPYGTVQVRVGSTALYHKIMGWIDGISR